MDTPPLRIDFVSDIACPWCAVGLHALEIALQRLGPAVAVELHVQPFELNPTMGAEGADAAAYLKAKYGMGDAQLARNRDAIRERGAAVGFAFGDRLRVWNTFDAHRLLHWAGLQDEVAAARRGGDADARPGAAAGATADAAGTAPVAATATHQWRLKRALLQAYHGAGRDPSDPAVLVAAATAAGLDGDAAAAVLADGRHADDVRAAERRWQEAGIQSVPATVVDRRHLISGGQPPEAFEQALRELAAARR